MARNPRKKPKVRTPPHAHKQPRTTPRGDPAQYDQETIVWAFGIVDRDGPWGWRTTAAPVWWDEILPKLQDFESMTWAEISGAAGGRAKGNNSHSVQVSGLAGKAKKRLAEIVQEDVSELFSLRLSGKVRIYGIRDRRALKLLWYDPYHDMKERAVYPVQGR